ncbi:MULTISPECIES: GTP-binding protein [unclassified Fibrobacter]|uniref:GTP-binding protein n=1 Tax=unclassified Fibrobacter TaxID=2634177 RepID=UPI000AD39CCD|nr:MULTISPECIES: GTP-binding protein [unclassified Fibrobacter]
MRKIALIVNDMGSINVDAEILKKNGSNVAECPMFELQNGCICCTLRDEFIEQVEKISNLNSIEVVFVDADRIYREFLSDQKHKKKQRDALADNPEVRENWDSRYGDRENQVVFIGKGYNKESIRTELEKCLD